MTSLVADFVFVGGPVFTGGVASVATKVGRPGLGIPAGPDPRAEAVAVLGDRILAVGREAEVRWLAGPATEVIDLKGRLLLPGFIDAHCHLVAYGFTRSEVDCKFPSVRSIRDIQARIRERAAVTAPGQWIRAQGYDQSRLEEGRHPTRFDLDAACADRPVVLSRTCGHIVVANTKALELAGVTAATPDPPGGKFDRDERGAPNGVLRETASQVLSSLVTPKHEEIVESAIIGMRDFLALGITSVHEAGVDAPTLRALQEVTQPPRLRVYAMLEPGDRAFQEAFQRAGLTTGFGSEWLKIGPVKLMADGSSSGPTAATREPYAVDPNDHGILYLSQDEINGRFAAAHRAGFQVTAHAVGDRAIEMIINGIEHVTTGRGSGNHGAGAGAGAASPGGAAAASHQGACLSRARDPRHRIEHCAMTDSGLRARIKALGIVPVLQPVFFHEFGDGYVRNYGRARASQMFAAGSFLRSGVPFALSTDCPVTSPDPMLNVYEALTRRTMRGEVVGPDERITVAQALSAYTAGAAYASFEEGLKGAIEPGKLADLVVVSGNPLEVETEELRGLKADLTMIGGRVVHLSPA